MSGTSDAFRMRTAISWATVNFFFVAPEMMRQVALRRAPSFFVAVKVILVVLVDLPEVLLAESHSCASSGISRVHSWSQEKTIDPLAPSSASRVMLFEVEKVMVASYVSSCSTGFSSTGSTGFVQAKAAARMVSGRNFRSAFIDVF